MNTFLTFLVLFVLTLAVIFFSITVYDKLREKWYNRKNRKYDEELEKYYTYIGMLKVDEAPDIQDIEELKDANKRFEAYYNGVFHK